jgi:hypothetical protein
MSKNLYQCANMTMCQLDNDKSGNETIECFHALQAKLPIILMNLILLELPNL